MNASVAIQVLPTVLDDEEVIRIVDAVIAMRARPLQNEASGPLSPCKACSASAGLLSRSSLSAVPVSASAICAASSVSRREKCGFMAKKIERSVKLSAGPCHLNLRGLPDELSDIA